jgi:hypothetical protein
MEVGRRERGEGRGEREVGRWGAGRKKLITDY